MYADFKNQFVKIRVICGKVFYRVLELRNEIVAKILSFNLH